MAFQAMQGNIQRRRRIHVLAKSVFLHRKSGAKARAPRLGNPGRGLHQLHGHRRSIFSPTRTPVGAALRLPRQPRHRMGLGSPKGQHPRRQLQRNVHRVRRPALGWRGIYRQSPVGSPRQTQLLCEASRTRTRDGRFHLLFRRATENVPAAHLQALADAALSLTVYSSA